MPAWNRAYGRPGSRRPCRRTACWIAPITGRFRALLEDREALDAILAKGAAKARERAAPTLSAAYEALGLVRG